MKHKMLRGACPASCTFPGEQQRRCRTNHNSNPKAPLKNSVRGVGLQPPPPPKTLGHELCQWPIYHSEN